MKRLQVTRFPTKRKAFDLANKRDYDRLIDEPTILEDEKGEPILLYDRNPWEYADVLGALRRIDYQSTNRNNKVRALGGDWNKAARIFGFMPRRIGRADFCHSASMSTHSPREHEIVCSYAPRLSEKFKEASPKRYAKHAEQLARVQPRWIIPGSVFTSGICNRNNALPYHHDSGNFKGAWSAMMGFSRDMEGGNLVFPEYRLAFSNEGANLFLFDGQAELHGVEYFRPKSESAYRFSIVYYALKQMCNCLSPEEELERVRSLKTAREKVRAQTGHAPGKR